MVLRFPPPFLSCDAIARPAHGRRLCPVPGPKAYIQQPWVSSFCKEVCLCSDNRDPVPFNSRRAGILPAGPAPDYLRQEGG